MHILFPLLCLLGIASSTSLHGPLTTDGRWIKDAHGDTVTFTGTNWPGHLEPMIPEGLQYQSYKDIIRKIKSIGMNAIRLTFAIEMVDEIFERNGTDVMLKETFISALGVENGTKILGQVLRKNKDFTEKTTRLEVRSIPVGGVCWKGANVEYRFLVRLRRNWQGMGCTYT